MALVFYDGFDMYNGGGANTGLGAKWGSGGGSLIAGRFGGQGYESVSGPSGTSITRSFTAIASIGVGCAFRMPAFPLANSVYSEIGLEKSGVETFCIRVTTTGAIEAYRQTGTLTGTLLGTSAVGVILLNTWQFIEIGVVISDTVGVVLIKVDGTTVLSLTGQDTNNAVTNVDTVRLGHRGIGGNNGTTDFDDFYLLDTSTTLGERRVETLRAAADTATKTWVPNSGSANFSRVNETLVDGDTSYVQAATVGDRDLYTIAPLSSTPLTIDAVQLVSFAEKTDATTRSIYNSLQSAGTDSDGSAFSLAASYGRFDRLLTTDPHTSAGWTASGVNGLRIGPKVAV